MGDITLEMVEAARQEWLKASDSENGYRLRMDAYDRYISLADRYREQELAK